LSDIETEIFGAKDIHQCNKIMATVKESIGIGMVSDKADDPNKGKVHIDQHAKQIK
jgi:hypothetical protein